MKASEISRSTVPQRVEVLTPNDWAPGGTLRKDTDVAVGLRSLSEAQLNSCHVDAFRKTAADMDDAQDRALLASVFSSHVKSITVARSLCDPNDATAPHPLFPFAEDQLPTALTHNAVGRLFVAIELAIIEGSSAGRELNDAEIEVLVGALLEDDTFHGVTARDARRVRRYLAYAADILSG